MRLLSDKLDMLQFPGNYLMKKRCHSLLDDLHKNNLECCLNLFNYLNARLNMFSGEILVKL